MSYKKNEVFEALKCCSKSASLRDCEKCPYGNFEGDVNYDCINLEKHALMVIGELREEKACLEYERERLLSELGDEKAARLQDSRRFKDTLASVFLKSKKEKEELLGKIRRGIYQKLNESIKNAEIFREFLAILDKIEKEGEEKDGKSV